ncbi:hypothetical protein CPB86DRAFT_810575 [Serendipita vermifera]|nr:hypothetical protein CPB86DRAFT_810575 [Serendipita vermifera]
MEDEEQEEDLEAIQAHMQMTLAMTYESINISMKDSTLPDDMVNDFGDAFKPRPPRLGVGATREVNGTAATQNSMAKETARLHGRLAGKKRPRDDDEDQHGAGSMVSLTNGVTKKLGRTTLNAKRQEEDSEEEESRTATISNKSKGGDTRVSALSGGKPNPMKDRFALPGQNKKKKKNQEDSKVNGIVTEGPNDRVTSEHEQPFSNPFSQHKRKDSDTLFRIPDLPASNHVPLKKTRQNASPLEDHYDHKSTDKRGTSSAESSHSDPLPSNPNSINSNPTHRKVPTPRTSPVVSLSSSTSKGSKSLARRSLLKQEAFASWSLVSVETVTKPDEPKSKPTQPGGGGGGSESHKVHKGPEADLHNATLGKEKNKSQPSKSVDLSSDTVLQLTPLSPSAAPPTTLGSTTEQGAKEGETESKNKKRRKRKKHKKKNSSTSDAHHGLSDSKINDAIDEDSD